MGTLKRVLKKIGRRGTELLRRYWWVVLLYYTLKGIAILLIGYHFLNA
jgi:hypothetical protein